MSKKKNEYFSKVHEEAIVRYAKSDCKQEKTDLYISLIQPAFDEMVEKIVYTYKFNNLPNIEYLKQDCKIWLTTILDKYDPNRKSKAFSYFSVITKNWFIAKIKKNTKALTREISYESLLSGGDIPGAEGYHVHPYEQDREQYEFMMHLKERMGAWGDETVKDKEKRVLQAINILFESVDDIEIFNKKAIYLYMREITGLNTKQIVSVLTKVKIKYRKFKTEWNEGEF
tara:strand:- start:1207 stop:1890 length:684 start_codon:yes stop_codon:yes gene_type:complete